MNNNFMKNNTATVNKIIAGILWLAFITSGFLFIRDQQGVEVLGSLLLEVAFTTFFIYKKKYQHATTIILLISILTCTVPYIETPLAGMVTMIVLCIVSLYLNKALLYGFGGLYVFAYTFIYYSNNHTFDVSFFSTLTFIALTILTLYFVCKRSTDLIHLSIQKETESKELLDSLDNMVSVIHENTSSLSVDINNCNNDIGTLKNISSKMATNVQEVTDGVINQSKSIDGYIANELNMTDNVSSIFTQIRVQAENISNISKKHAEATDEMLATTQEQGANIEVIYNSIGNINNSSVKLHELIEKR